MAAEEKRSTFATCQDWCPNRDSFGALSEKKMKKIRRIQQGSALLPALGILLVVSVAASSYIGHATSSYTVDYRESLSIQTTPLCEAAAQELQYQLWLPFKGTQNFTAMDAIATGSSTANPTNTISGSIPGVGQYSAGIISYIPDPLSPNYGRYVTMRCVGWLDRNNNGVLDAGEPQRIVDVTVEFTLQRSQVFDYTYFVNNYGWWDGYTPNDCFVNGDMRANGNFSFTNGSPTVNGSVYAAANNKLIPTVSGLVNNDPVKDTDAQYAAAAASDSRMRQAYDPTTMGAIGSPDWLKWKNNLFETTGVIAGNQPFGAVIGDSTGTKSWTNTGSGTTTNLIDSTPTSEIAMPDLSDIANYAARSQAYVDDKASWPDGTANPNYGQGAYVKVWNSSTSSYKTVTTNGVVNGSAALVGTSAHPIQIHGPVTFTQDAVITGYVSGQGTLYTGRNVHVVGSVLYSNPPSFQGTDPTAIADQNAKADMLGLAANGSIIMGDVSTFSNPYPLKYMTPPFTKPRYDDNGNLIAAYNALTKDSTGCYKYQSTMGNSLIHSLSSPVDQIDAVMYTNFVGGGDLGVGGHGVTINGSIISKDESMVTWSLPMKMNYDGRIKETSPNGSPLIDIDLPRSPAILDSSWQDRGFYWSGN